MELADKLVKRKLAEEIKKFVARKEVLIIRGPRQAGKTTLMKMLESELDNNFDKLFVNLDLPEKRRELEANPLDFVDRYKKEKPLLLFLDEVQRCKDIGEGLKIVADERQNIKIIASGSSSLEIKTKILPFLVGRAFLFELLTFDFGEFVSSKDLGLAKILARKQCSLRTFVDTKSQIEKPSFTSELAALFKEYAIYGGYPAVVQVATVEEKLKILRSIEDLYLEKDIVSFFRIEESNKFEDFAKMLGFQISNLLNLANLASNVKISYNKAEEFLEILTHTYIIKLLRPFYKNLKTELRKAPKIYFLDLGMRNSLINNFLVWESRDDKGKLAENFVLRELLTNWSDYEIKYWRTTGKAEVDFVLSRGNQIIPIEVKLEGGKVGKSFYSFINAYKPKIAFIATLDMFTTKQIGDTKVFFVPLWYF